MTLVIHPCIGNSFPTQLQDFINIGTRSEFVTGYLPDRIEHLTRVFLPEFKVTALTSLRSQGHNLYFQIGQGQAVKVK